MIRRMYRVWVLSKLASKLRGWQKQNPFYYALLIKESVGLINDYGLAKGESSPKFTLPNEQLDEMFIRKLFKAIENEGYEVINVKERVKSSTFQIKRN